MQCGEYIIIDTLNGGDSIYSLKTKELINTNLNISKIIETDGKIFRLVTSDEESIYRVGNIEVLNLETGKIDRIAENINQDYIKYEDGYYYYMDFKNNLLLFNVNWIKNRMIIINEIGERYSRGCILG